MKALGVLLVGLGCLWAFISAMFFFLEEYTRSQGSILSVLAGLFVAFLGILCLRNRI